MPELSTKDLFHSTIIHEDGTKEESYTTNKLTLKELQSYVGGYIEVSSCRKDDEDFMMIINEEGRLQNLGVNKTASEMFCNWLSYHDRATPIPNVVGTVVVLNNYELD